MTSSAEACSVACARHAACTATCTATSASATSASAAYACAASSRGEAVPAARAALEIARDALHHAGQVVVAEGCEEAKQRVRPQHEHVHVEQQHLPHAQGGRLDAWGCGLGAWGCRLCAWGAGRVRGALCSSTCGPTIPRSQPYSSAWILRPHSVRGRPPRSSPEIWSRSTCTALWNGRATRGSAASGLFVISTVGSTPASAVAERWAPTAQPGSSCWAPRCA